MNDGTNRTTIIRQNGRHTSGLHLCVNCVAICMRTWPSASGAMIAISDTPWSGPCDLCLFVATLSGMLNGPEETDHDGPSTPVHPV